MRKHDFCQSGGIISSLDRDDNVYYQGCRDGSSCVYGRYELGRSYVARVLNEKPNLLGFPEDKVKVINRDQCSLKEGKYYVFELVRIELGELRHLIKIKVRMVEEYKGCFREE